MAMVTNAHGRRDEMLSYQSIIGTRAYTVRETLPEVFLVEYRPVNPKTGKPWQAFRVVARFDGPRAKAKAMARWLKETTEARRGQ